MILKETLTFLSQSNLVLQYRKTIEINIKMEIRIMIEMKSSLESDGLTSDSISHSEHVRDLVWFGADKVRDISTRAVRLNKNIRVINRVMWSTWSCDQRGHVIHAVMRLGVRLLHPHWAKRHFISDCECDLRFQWQKLINMIIINK